MAGGERHRRLGQIGAGEAGRTMDALGGLEAPENRPRAAGVHRHVDALRELADAPGVPGRQLERHVAGDRGHRHHLELGRRQRQQKRHCVVLTGVAIDDDRPCNHGRKLNGKWRAGASDFTRSPLLRRRE